MARRLSRRVVTSFVAERLQEGDKSVVKQLAAYLVTTRQIRMLALYVRDIESSLAKKGDVSADVTTAFSLSAETKKHINAFVAAETGALSVSLREHVKSEVLGGLRLHIPGKELDTTVQRQLTTLRTQLKKA
ncbi:F0F1 ATP synthase subunit delta [Candidatus Saccharibacteria bacterium]|nr:F0F1 ATP synthase subunit delta [Candidatus Saccharibacteria bacterium]